MNKKDVRNLLYLITIQGTNAILPIFIYPYVLLKIGTTLYSQVAIAENISIFMLTFVLYGFEIDGVSMVVNNKNGPQTNRLSEIFSCIFYARALILLCCVFLTLTVAAFFHNQLFLLTLGWALIPVGHILQNSYLYIGLEDNFITAICTIIGRVLCIILVLVFVHSPSDFYKAPYIIGSTYVLGGAYSLIYILTKLKLKFIKVSLKKIIITLLDSKEVFLGNLSTMLYRDSNLLILGVTSNNPATIAAYSIANKSINALQAIARPLNQLFFPKTISNLKNITSPNRRAFHIILKMTTYQLGILIISITCITGGLLFVNRYTCLLKPYTEKLGEITTYFCIMLLAVFIGVCNFMFGSVGLNYLSMKKYYASTMLLTGIITILTGFILALSFSGIGASINFVMGEFTLFILIFCKYFNVNSSLGIR